ncbi:MAG: hypothetical protein V1824_01195 [archaeon]
MVYENFNVSEVTGAIIRYYSNTIKYPSGQKKPFYLTLTVDKFIAEVKEQALYKSLPAEEKANFENRCLKDLKIRWFPQNFAEDYVNYLRATEEKINENILAIFIRKLERIDIYKHLDIEEKSKVETELFSYLRKNGFSAKDFKKKKISLYKILTTDKSKKYPEILIRNTSNLGWTMMDVLEVKVKEKYDKCTSDNIKLFLSKSLKNNPLALEVIISQYGFPRKQKILTGKIIDPVKNFSKAIIFGPKQQYLGFYKKDLIKEQFDLRHKAKEGKKQQFKKRVTAKF